VPGHVYPKTGNTVVDAVIRYGPAARLPLADRRRAILLTLHRAENVDDAEVLGGLIGGVDRVAREFGLDVVFPAHPRTLARLAEYSIPVPTVFEIIPSTGYRDLLSLQSEVRLVMTDSGGLQDESCILGTPCVTLRISTERPETVEVGANAVVGTLTATAVLETARVMLARESNDWGQPLGDGFASRRILDAIA